MLQLPVPTVLMGGSSAVLSELPHQGDDRHQDARRSKPDLRPLGTGPLPARLLQIGTHPPPPVILQTGTQLAPEPSNFTERDRSSGEKFIWQPPSYG